MATLALDPQTRTIAIPMRLLTGLEELGQKLSLRLANEQGSWFLDTAEGVPYAEWLGEPTPPLRVMEEFLTSVVATTPGVRRVEEVRCTFDAATQVTEYAATVRADDTVLGVDPDRELVVGTALGASGDLLRAYFTLGGI